MTNVFCSAQKRFDQELEPITKTGLFWWGPRNRETELSYYTYWKSKCHQYRVTRSISKFGQDQEFVAEMVLDHRHERIPTQFEGQEWALNGNGIGYISRIIGTHHTLEGVIILCEKHYMRRKAVHILDSNKIHILKLAEELGIHLIQRAPNSNMLEGGKPPKKVKEEDNSLEGLLKALKTPKQGKSRIQFLGFPVTHVLRWMGANGWTKEQAIKVMEKANIAVAEGTIGIQVAAGKKGDKSRGETPELSKSQIKELNSYK